MMQPELTGEHSGKQDWRWKHACIDAYKPLVSVKGWKLCPGCKQFPRLWIFDNGRFAKCLCGWDNGPYQNEFVEAISICQYYRENNESLAGYDNSALQKAWNARCIKMKGA